MAAARDASEALSDTSSEVDVSEVHRPVLDAIKQHVFYESRGSEAWQRMPEIPAGSEIMVSQAEAEPLPHNFIDRVWPSKNDYLETHYRLLRREGTEALRYAVNKYKSNIAAGDDEDLCIYTKVRVAGYLMTRLGPLCRISFSTEHAQKKIVWQQSRRLVPGSVLAISTKRDNFESVCMTATVAQRPYRGGLDQNPPLVDIVWGNVNEYVIDPDMELVVIEARSGYFESVRHTLVGLQMAAESDSTLFKYVVKGDKTDGPASFIREKPLLDLTSCLSPTTDRGLKQWLRKYDVREPAPDIRGQTSLDETQLHALYRMITKELCIVQGPPGTGKTFTSVEALKIILANQSKNDPPIIVAAQTNHALDQLLTLCLDAGARIVRVGGRTESERIAEHTMFNTRQKFGSSGEPLFRAIDAKRRQACRALTDLTRTVFNDGLLQPEDLLSNGVITQEQYDSLVDDDMEQTAIHRPHGPFSLWIAGECIETEVIRNKHCDENLSGDDEEYNPEEYEYEDDFANVADDEEDKDRIHGTFIPFMYKWTGKEPGHLSSWYKRAGRELKKADLYAIPKNMRGAVYQLLFERYIEKLKPRFIHYFVDYIKWCKEVKANKWLQDIQMVKQLQVNIVGCTTTGLTKYRGFLAAMGAKTMLIEEAAETRESNITSALYPSIQQLILVGDHMQLAPYCNVRWLGQNPYYLDLSMFERMVNHLGIPYIMLDKQRRMAPEIRAVMVHFYDGLVDHPVALKRDPVPGMGDRRTWLFAHNWEDSVDNNHSRFNSEEASMIANFFAYLVNNGIKQSQITVLTFYKAQRRVLLRKLKMHPSLVTIDEPFEVHTVDSYQGEENDIVLLSLVRSPAAHREYAVGFLDNKNRVIVAISRARRGFYVFGNIVNAANASRESKEIWTPIWNAFINQKRYDPARGLPLQCQPHGNTIWIKNTSGWADNTGGCDQRCNFIRDCGHQCAFPCHVIPHDKIRCSHVCHKLLACGHKCPLWCKDPCHCSCPSFQAMKALNETRQIQDEDKLHMDLEEILEAEAGDSWQPEATHSKPEDLQTVLAEQATPSISSAMTGPRNVIRLGSQDLRKLGPLRGTPESSHVAPVVRPPPQTYAGPIIRPRAQRQRGVVQTGAAAFQSFARNIDAHDKENVKARLAALAETAGQEPTIRDVYRPVALVDGRRIESPEKSSPEKEVENLQDGLAQFSEGAGTSKSNLTNTLLPDLSFDEDSKGVRRKTVKRHISNIEALTNALTLVPADRSALSITGHVPSGEWSPGRRNSLSRSTVSAVPSGVDVADFLMDEFTSNATAVDPTRRLPDKGKGKASLDLAGLMVEPSVQPLTASRLSASLEQAGDTLSQPYSSLSKWMETVPYGSLVTDQPKQVHEGSDISALHAYSAECRNDGDNEKEEDALIIL